MWQILTAEFRYTRDGLILTYSIAAIFLIATVMVDGWGFHNFMWNTTVTYFIFMWILGAGTYHEKRYRLFATLPVRPQEIATVDVLYVLLVQLGMSVLWIVYLLFRPEEMRPYTLWVMVANNGLILTVVSIFGIHYHAGFFETKKYRRADWLGLLALIAGVAVLIYMGRMSAVARSLWRYYASAPGAFAVVLLSIAVSAVCSEVYVRRKSYLA